VALHAGWLAAGVFRRRVLGLAFAWTTGGLRLRTRLHLRDEEVRGLVRRRSGGWEVSLAARVGPLTVGLAQEEDLPGRGVPRPAVGDLVLLVRQQWWDLALGRRDARWSEGGVWRAGLRLRPVPVFSFSIRGGVAEWALVLATRAGRVGLDLGLPLASDDPSGPVLALHWPASSEEAPWPVGSSPR
jgi:hypothetical protein